MKGLRKYLTPFAPDQSGAVSVLYELGGILVICDAGGCTGNICGFDEPRWFTRRSAVFSAGLRDMDAILGRDERLVAKLHATAEKIHAEFAAIIGTPVPSVVGTDYRALRRMAEKQLPVLTVDTTGMDLYDVGQEKAYLELMRRFAVEQMPVERRRLGVLGATPLDLSDIHAGQRLREVLIAQGWSRVDVYGMDADLSAVRSASAAQQNLVVSPSGRKAAAYLEETFGTPYTVLDPLAVMQPAQVPAGRRALVIHQQVRANGIRERLLEAGYDTVHAATWFLKLPELSQKGDLRLTEEDQLQDLVAQGRYDLIVGDLCLREALPDYHGAWMDAPHFAVSGRLIP